MRSAVITLVAGRHAHLALQRRGLLAGSFRPDAHIVVTMNDPSARDVLEPGTPDPDIVALRCPPEVVRKRRRIHHLERNSFSVEVCLDEVDQVSQTQDAYLTSTHFKREPDASKWNPTKCE